MSQGILLFGQSASDSLGFIVLAASVVLIALGDQGSPVSQVGWRQHRGGMYSSAYALDDGY
ncbi:hypothetical protein [Kibdelosporangium aridum]|uniref:hypothetical protein n=1 Tax=Kibdelosporangium aridum TaxID=2030 RepID=UPI0009FCB1F8|nr:hypothetical protein [Kibdelosporangium aridum]